MLQKYLCFHPSKKQRKHSPTVIEELCHQFSLADLRKSTNNFSDALIVGKGDFRTVYKGCIKHNGAANLPIALKRFGRCTSSKGILVFTMEIELLCQLHHPNVVSPIGFCNHKHEKIIMYEYMSKGSLHDHLHNRRDMKPLSWKKRLEICIGTARGLHYLHTGTKRIIIHRDIKPRNILLDNNMVPKLSDFSYSLLGQLSTSKPKPIHIHNVSAPPEYHESGGLICKDKRGDSLVVGTIGYTDPEYIKTGVLTEASDVFSFGMVLLEVVTAKKARDLYEEHVKERNHSLQSDAKKIVDPFLESKIAPDCWKTFIGIT